MKVLKIFDLAFFLIRLSCMMLLLLHIWGYRIPRTLYSISPPSNYRTNAVRKTTHSAVSLLKCVPVKKSPKFPYCTYTYCLTATSSCLPGNVGDKMKLHLSFSYPDCTPHTCCPYFLEILRIVVCLSLIQALTFLCVHPSIFSYCNYLSY